MTMNKAEYKEYLRSAHWQSWKKYLYGKYGACQKCGAKKNLDVHHLTYEHLGAEWEADLILVCRTCHYNLYHAHRMKQPPKRMGIFRELIYLITGI